MKTRSRLAATLASLTLVFSLAAVDYADARRGGGFGSRGGRTFDAPPVTRTAPTDAAPINRSVTQPTTAARPGATGAAAQAGQRGGLFNGRGLIGGLMLGGLFGLLLGQGFGGLGGMLALLFQGLLIALAVWLLLRFFRSRSGAAQGPQRGAPAYAHAGAGAGAGLGGMRMNRQAEPAPQPARTGPIGGGAGAAMPKARRAPSDAVGITPADYDAFEQNLHAVQAAFTREDYDALRRLATPEVMSHLAEELSVNATRGVRNEVSDVRLLQGDLAEAWREGTTDYATVAMRYSSVDVLRDRQTGAIVEGTESPTETVEIWTFLRERGGDWKLSAIQDA
ncbi:Tim44 domain-containing protein [Antarcticirhabdus aurantiaca]|uniref:TIM44-like domain-containing protein n=1 Tax=Antarcticirhabdus aurantiaca TaxID=2606717 RepID=A0ACD4NI92_9HYPH|nr:TIM44-like domain-containing protein [Antarcticirhabdus aurantiaca]WAJ26513.1 TIM44-like domain-containing protein [Jeongeuplla avenae]